MSELALWRLASRSLTLASILAGCATGADFQEPMVAEGGRMAGAGVFVEPARSGSPEHGISSAVPAGTHWWEALGSVALNGLVGQALSGSPTLESARATLAQAEQVLHAAQGAAYPRLTLAASVQRSNEGVARSAGAPANLFSVGPALDFTPDIFGATRHRVGQARALRDYQRAQERAAQLTIAGNTVLQAVALAAVGEQIAAVQAVIAVDEQNLALVQLSADAGKSAHLDVLAARSQLSSDRALLPALLQQASVARHALAVLAGTLPVEWSAPALSLDDLVLPSEWPTRVPSEWLLQRPDIVAAEAQLRAANAAVGIASAQLYPSLTLSAGWTSSARSFNGLFSSSLWNIAASLLAPVFDGQVLAAQRAAAVEAYAAQLGSYRQTLLVAFGQVADVLDALQQGATLVEAQSVALEAARDTLSLTQQAYQAGQANLLQLLQAQRLYQQALIGRARARGQQYADWAQWFIALGGAVATPP